MPLLPTLISQNSSQDHQFQGGQEVKFCYVSSRGKNWKYLVSSTNDPLCPTIYLKSVLTDELEQRSTLLRPRVHIDLPFFLTLLLSSNTQWSQEI